MSVASAESPPRPASGPHEPLPEVPGFEVGALLGRGGMGRVYRAREVATGRDVALKWLDASAPEEMRNRFARESRAAASLSHPNIARVFATGRTPRGD